MTLSPSRKVIIIIIIRKKKLPAWPRPVRTLGRSVIFVLNMKGLAVPLQAHTSLGLSWVSAGPVTQLRTAAAGWLWGAWLRKQLLGHRDHKHLPETDIPSCCPAAAPGKSQRGASCCHRGERPPSSDLSTTKLLQCHTVFYVNTYFIFQNWKRYKYIVPWIPDALGNLATKYATSPTTEYYHALHSTNKQAAQISLADDLG